MERSHEDIRLRIGPAGRGAAHYPASPPATPIRAAARPARALVLLVLLATLAGCGRDDVRPTPRASAPATPAATRDWPMVAPDDPAAANAVLMRAISLPKALLVAHHFLYRWTSELFDTEPFLPEHLEIVARLQAGDVPGAQAALVHHLKISRQRAMLRIQAVAQVIEPDELPYLERLEPV